MSVKPGLKKRRAPLPEEVYPNLVGEIPTNAHPDELRVGTGLNTTSSAEIKSTTLPFCERSKGPTSAFKRHSLPTGVPKVTLNDIRFPSDNEALDVHESSENNVKALNPTDYGKKRYSSGDIPKYTGLPYHSGSSVHLFNTSGRLSISLNSISSATSTEYAESQMVDQEDIVNLTRHVRKFSDALSKLRSAFSGSGSDTDSDEYIENGNTNEDMHVKAHKHLGKVLSNLKEVMHQYPSLQSKEILEAAGYLIGKVKQHNYEENRIPVDFYQSIDQLALVFSSSISDFLMGDQEPSPKTVDGAGDCVDEFPEDGDEEDFSEGDGLHERQNDAVKPDDVETDLTQVILGMKSGVDFCLQWTKSWSKYVKDIANYIEKRAQLEADYTKQLAKLAQTTRHSICEEEYLPFQSTFSTALDQDLEYSQRCQQTQIAITGSKLMEPLMQRRAYHDRARKDMKDQWTKVCKQLHDHEGSVKTSQNMYYKKKQELKKLSTKQSDLKDSKDDSSSVISVFGTSKGKKEEELKLKVDEAKQFYISALEDINKVQKEAENTKVWIVTQTIQLVNECDRTFRSATRKYFDLMHELAVPTPIHFKTLAESCHGYEPGKQFERAVRFKQSTAQSAVHALHEFEEYRGTSPHYLGHLTTVEATSPIKTWLGSRDSDVENGLSPSGSPSSSPPRRRSSRPPPSTDDDSDGEIKPELHTTITLRKNKRGKGSSVNKKISSKNAATHTFHKIRAPARCSECDSATVFNGVECGQCGLSCHKRCLENLNTPCSHSRRRPSPMKRMKTFGVRFSEDGGVPVLVTKCVNELNRRGLQVKGIYRVSGVKSKMEGLCQDFETNADSVDLSNQPPHLIASVLKLYIRQLPEPLMTTTLYGELIQLAKENPNIHSLTYEEYNNDKDRNDFKKLLERLKEILSKLPKSNYLTTATLIKHLHKVAKNEEYNQMNSQNLAIVFGPTILRLGSENSTSSLSSLVDMPHQTRIVAFLIVHPQLFDKAGDDKAAWSNQESEKNNDTLVEKFVSPQPERETRMPDLYGVRSTRVRGEGPSPMDKLQSPDVQENKRIVHDTSRIDERIDVKDETAGIFDDNGISLPGSLETQHEFLDWVPDDEDLSVRDVDVGLLRNNSHKYTEINPTGDSTKGGSPSRTVDGSPRGESSRLPREVSFDLDDSKSSVDSTETPRQGSDETLPSGVAHNEEQDKDEIIPRRRSKAFSASKRNDPEMLAKRGSALMNAYIDGNPKTDDTAQTSSSGLPTKRTTSDTYGDVDVDRGNETSEAFANSGESQTPSPTITSEIAAKSEAAEPESQTRAATKDGSETPRIKAATSSENVTTESSGDELTRWLSSEGRIPHRRRSATYDSDRRTDDRQLTGERKLDFGMRSRRTRVSVKDHIMQLEQRGNKSDASRDSSLSADARVRASSDTRRNADESARWESVDGKTNLDDDKGDESPPRKTMRDHEPLSRVRVMGGHIGQSGTEGALLITLPSSPGGMRSPPDEELPFRALKMDISLESPRTPSSNSSDEDVSKADVGRGTHLNTWAGRGLTPRDSNQAPEFV